MNDSDDVRVFRPKRAAPADAVRPTRAEINLEALRHNLRTVRAITRGDSRASAIGPAIYAVLKADAYGHGAPAVARTLERAGVDGLCVALLEEGVELREAGIQVPITVMGGYYGPHHRGLEDALVHRLTPVLYDVAQIERLEQIVRDEEGLTRGARAAFHWKVDTGMSRLGSSEAEVDRALDTVGASPHVELAGLMSHFATADDPDLQPALAQLSRFRAVQSRLAARGVTPSVSHMANSAAAVRLEGARFDAVRIGLMLYGIEPCALPEGASLKPAMRVRTEIVALRQLRAGDRVGYGHTWESDGDRVIATVPMGYADGLSRSLSNKGHMIVRGVRVPVVGIVSMDLTTIDVTNVPGVALGDEVVVLGGGIRAEEIASHMGSIPWEVITSISRRVPRFYREP